MSVLSDNPELVAHALAACIRRLGGSVVIQEAEITPFSIASKLDEKGLHLMVVDYTPEAGGRVQ